jgi:hypothetical protein
MGDSFHYIKQQALCMILGLGCMFLISYVDHRFLRKMVVPGYFIVLAMLAVTLTMAPLNGCRRWIRFAGLTLQSSEVAKFEMILFSSHLAAKAPQVERLDPERRILLTPREWLRVRVWKQLVVPVLPLIPVVIQQGARRDGTRPCQHTAAAGQQQDGAHHRHRQHDAGHVRLHHEQQNDRQQREQRQEQLPHQPLLQPGPHRHPAAAAHAVPLVAQAAGQQMKGIAGADRAGHAVVARHMKAGAAVVGGKVVVGVQPGGALAGAGRARPLLRAFGFQHGIRQAANVQVAADRGQAMLGKHFIRAGVGE